MKLRSSAARLATLFTATGIAVVLAAGFGFDASAQAPKQAPVKAQKQPAPARAPAASELPAIQDPNVTEATATPWTRICVKDPQTGKDVCLTSQELRADSGQLLVSTMIREMQDDPKKLLIVSIPQGMLLRPGMRAILDQNAPQPMAYSFCFANACYGDMDINAEYIGGMKKATQFVVQAINPAGRTVNYPFSLKDFAKTYDGPPTDPKVVEERQKKFLEELQKRADEQRKRLESQQPTPPAAR